LSTPFEVFHSNIIKIRMNRAKARFAGSVHGVVVQITM